MLAVFVSDGSTFKMNRNHCSAGRNFEAFACLGLKYLAVNVNSEVAVFLQLF